MGTSTDAILVWGVAIEHGSDDHWRVYKMVNDESDVDLEELELKPIEATEKDLEKLAVEIVWHCSYEEPMFIVALISSRTSASRGNPKAIDSLVVPGNAQEKLDKALELLGIEQEAGGWILCSMWG